MRNIEDLSMLTKKCIDIGTKLPNAGSYTYNDIRNLVELKSSLTLLDNWIFEDETYRDYILKNIDWSATFLGDVKCHLTTSYKGIRFSSKSDIYLICEFETLNETYRVVVPILPDNVGFTLYGVIAFAEPSRMVEAHEYAFIIQKKNTKKEVKHLLKFTQERTVDMFSAQEHFSLTRLEDALLLAFINFNTQRALDQIDSKSYMQVSLLRTWTKMLIDVESENLSGLSDKYVELDERFLTFEDFSEWAYAQNYKSGRNVCRIDEEGNYVTTNCYIDNDTPLFPFNSENFTPCPERYYYILPEKKFVPQRYFYYIPLSIDGETKTLYEWENETGIDLYLIHSRYQLGLSESELVRLDEQRVEYTNRLITYKNETRTVKEWSEITNISMKTIISRIRYGWKEDQLFLPVQQRTK